MPDKGLGLAGRARFAVPLFVSGFRPFFLAAAVYGPLLMLGWFAARSGWWGEPRSSLVLVHAHELLYGFAGALVCGVLLTALPSWSGARELRGRRLAVLFTLWILGRGACLASGVLPAGAVAAIDCAWLPVLCLLLALAARRGSLRLLVWTTPPLAAFTIANFAYYRALLAGASDDAHWALRLALHALVFLFTLYGGLFIAAFTRRWLRQRGEHSAAMLRPLENGIAVAMTAFAVADLVHAGPRMMAAAAFLAASLHAWRWLRWRGWLAAREPLLLSMHVAYGWLIVALVLRAISGFVPAVPPDAWIHAFTVGAYGMLKITLMTRVVLKHTGRPVVVSAPMRVAYLMMFAAAVLRVGRAPVAFGDWALGVSALLWSAALLVYLASHGPMLLRPSLPRTHPVPA